MRVAKSSLLVQLSQESLSSLIPGFIELAQDCGIVKVFKNKEIIQDIDQEFQYLILPLSGFLRLKTKQGNRLKSYGPLQESRSVGLRPILFNEKSKYYVQADGPVQVLLIPISRFLSHLQKYPLVCHYLKLMVSSSAIRNFKTYLEDLELEKENIFEIFKSIEIEKVLVAAGESVVPQEPSLLFIASGRLKLETTDFKSKGLDLNEGEWLGCEALVAPGLLPYTVIASEDVVLHQAPVWKIKPALEKWGLISELVLESFEKLKVSKKSSKVRWPETELPGTPFVENDWKVLNLRDYTSELHFGRKALNSLANPIYNLLKLKQSPARQDLIEASFAKNGFSYVQAAKALERFGFSCNASVANINSLKSADLPCLVGYGPRVAVLLGVGQKDVQLIDSVQGPLRILKQDFLKHWNEQVLLVDSVTADLEENAFHSPLGLMKFSLKGQSRIVTAMLAMKTLTLVIGFVIPVLAGLTLDKLFVKAPFMEVFWLALLGFAIFLFSVGLDYISDLNGAELDRNIDLRLRTQFFRRLANIKSSVRVNHGDASIYERELSEFAGFSNGILTQTSFDIISIFILIGILSFIEPWLALGGLLFFAAAAGGRRLIVKPMRQAYEKELALEAERRQKLTDYIQSIETIKTSGASKQVLNQLEGVFVKEAHQQLKTSHFMRFFDVTMGLLTFSFCTAALYFTSMLYLDGGIGLGHVMTISIYVAAFAGHAQALGDKIGIWEDVKISISKIRDFLNLSTESKPSEAVLKTAPNLSGFIELKDVSCRYDDKGPFVLNKLSLTIYPRQIVAIVGRSGSGKSTLAKLITGDVTPVSGSIYFDGIDSRSIDSLCLRTQIALISQENQLFSGTIEENVTFGDDRPNRRKIIQSLENSAALSIVESTHGQLNHFLTEGGDGLSGGEKQRIAISRTYYKDSQIYLFDEATSALDAESESVVVHNLKSALNGKTAVLIAHRYSTVRAADRIIVLHEGQVVEDGTHDELVRLNGFYADLFSAQYEMNREA